MPWFLVYKGVSKFTCSWVIGHEFKKDSNNSKHEDSPKENTGPFIQSSCMRKVSKQNRHYTHKESIWCLQGKILFLLQNRCDKPKKIDIEPV